MSFDFGNSNFAVSVGTIAWEAMTSHGDIITSRITIPDFSLSILSLFLRHHFISAVSLRAVLYMCECRGCTKVCVHKTCFHGLFYAVVHIQSCVAIINGMQWCAHLGQFLSDLNVVLVLQLQ